VTSRARKGAKASPDQQAQAFREFWAAYPNKVGAKVAAVAFAKALAKLGPDPLAVLLPALERAKASRQWLEGFVPHPSTWLNQERWNDEHPTQPSPGGPAGPSARDAERNQRLQAVDAAMRAAFVEATGGGSD
jgi:hypothetical protein